MQDYEFVLITNNFLLLIVFFLDQYNYTQLYLVKTFDFIPVFVVLHRFQLEILNRVNSSPILRFKWPKNFKA